MNYFDDYNILKSYFNQEEDIINIPSLNLDMVSCSFNSDFTSEIPTDSVIKENNSFRYSIIRKAGRDSSNEIIIMLHGLNEKSWSNIFHGLKDCMSLPEKMSYYFRYRFI